MTPKTQTPLSFDPCLWSTCCCGVKLLSKYLKSKHKSNWLFLLSKAKELRGQVCNYDMFSGKSQLYTQKHFNQLLQQQSFVTFWLVYFSSWVHPDCNLGGKRWTRNHISRRPVGFYGCCDTDTQKYQWETMRGCCYFSIFFFIFISVLLSVFTQLHAS